MTALSERELSMEPWSPDAIRRACLSRHVRLAQVPADHIRVYHVNRLDTVMPIKGSHRDVQCTSRIVSRSMGMSLLLPETELAS